MRIARFCDWLLRTFCADEPIREGQAVTWWAWSTLLDENERLRRERNAWMQEANRAI